jgi:hypothetical protein
MTTIFKYRLVLTGFMIGLALSGLTAFPLVYELNLLADWLIPYRTQFPSLVDWILKVRQGLVETDSKYPFIAYGTDWLAFAHLMIAAAYIGPWREPVRNRWIIEWGMFCCIATFPVVFICGPIRGIPWGWMAVDCAFGLLAFPGLLACWKWSKQLELESQSALVGESDYRVEAEIGKVAH